jgi:hypothetical protein
MILNKKYKIAIVILISVLLAGLYINRVNIYEPIKLEILFEDNYSYHDCKVSVVTILGRTIEIVQDSVANDFCIDFGYFNKIKIEGDITKSIDIRIFNNDDNSVLEYDVSISDKYFIITKVGKKSFVDIIKRIIEVSGLKLIVILLLYIFSVIFFVNFSSRIITLYSWLIALGLLIAMIALLFTAAYFTYPNAEELSNTVVSNNTQSIAKNAFSYLSLDTRFTSNFLYSFSPLAIGGVEWHRFSVYLFLILLFASVVYFFWQISSYAFSFRQIGIAGIGFVLIHLAIIPDIAYDLFFVASSAVYLMAWVAVFLWVSTFLEWINTEKYTRKTVFGMLTTLLFIMSFGYSEMNFVLNLFVLVLLSFYILKYRKKSKHELLIMWVILFAVLAFVVVIPGFDNRVSSAGLVTMFDTVFKSIKVSVYAISVSIVQWTFLKVVYIPLILIASIAIYPKLKKLNILFTTKELLGLLIFALAFMYSCYAFYIYFAVYYHTDVFILRSLNYLNWAFQLIILLILPLIINRLFPNLLSRLYKQFNYVVLISLIVISSSLILGTNNYKILYNDFVSGDYANYKNQMIERYAKINKAKGQETWKIAEVDEISRYPISIFVQPDLGWEKQKQDAIGDYSHYYERFFEIDEIKLKSDSVNMALKLLNYE